MPWALNIYSKMFPYGYPTYSLSFTYRSVRLLACSLAHNSLKTISDHWQLISIMTMLDVCAHAISLQRLSSISAMRHKLCSVYESKIINNTQMCRQRSCRNSIPTPSPPPSSSLYSIIWPLPSYSTNLFKTGTKAFNYGKINCEKVSTYGFQITTAPRTQLSWGVVFRVTSPFHVIFFSWFNGDSIMSLDQLKLSINPCGHFININCYSKNLQHTLELDDPNFGFQNI